MGENFFGGKGNVFFVGFPDLHWQVGSTWRIIPVSKWFISMVSFHPLSRVMGPLPNGRYKWLINGGDPNYLRPSWDDPPR